MRRRFGLLTAGAGARMARRGVVTAATVLCLLATAGTTALVNDEFVPQVAQALSVAEEDIPALLERWSRLPMPDELRREVPA